MTINIYIDKDMFPFYEELYVSYELMETLYGKTNESALSRYAKTINDNLFVNLDRYINKFAITNFAIMSHFIAIKIRNCTTAHIYLCSVDMKHLLTLFYDMNKFSGIESPLDIVFYTKDGIPPQISPALQKILNEHNIHIHKGYE